ncbi:MAG: xanthine dehydrogenase family protein subunit M [Gemmatimonadota bacterium]|nr:xanthine dehydrogenase family protein subunit M [Gemmatimonadota bacterium]
MHPFAYHSADSLADAVRHLADPGTAPLGGGTDLLVLIQEGLATPNVLVDLRRMPGARGVIVESDGAVRIGAATRVGDLAEDAVIRERFPALAQACEAVGTPALRNMGTIGGNLCQRPRCWYFRRNVHCHKNGGDSCPAVDGENQYLAILGGGPCYIVHPSDPAIALTALDAHVEVTGPGGSRWVEMARFYNLPRQRMDHETVLEHSEFVSAIALPPESIGGEQHYYKLMQRGAWDFALVSLAAVKRPDGEVRLVLGGVAPRPWRVTSSVEEDVSTGGLDDDAIETLAVRALIDAEPLSENAYKVELAAALLRQAMAELGGEG